MTLGQIEKTLIYEYHVECAHCGVLDVAHYSTMLQFKKHIRSLGWHTVNKLWYCKHCKQ